MRIACFTILVAFLGACTSHERQPPAQALPGENATGVAGAGTIPTLGELQNQTYNGLEGAPGPVPLVDGRWEGEPLVAGGAARPSVHFVRDFRLDGDLDGDGVVEVVVLLGARGGGTGEFIHLAVVGRREGRWQNVATAMVGDRVQVRSARLEAGSIVLDVVQAGATDALCCPGDLVTRTWKLRPVGLEEAPAKPGGRLALAVLAGSEWVLRGWTWDEAVTGDIEVTLVVQGDRCAGNSGCNRYFATVTAGAMPGDVSVGPLAGTRMACADPAAAVESRFRSQLRGVKKFGFIAGQLALSFEKDGVRDTMLFTGRVPRAE